MLKIVLSFDGCINVWWQEYLTDTVAMDYNIRYPFIKLQFTEVRIHFKNYFSEKMCKLLFNCTSFIMKPGDLFEYYYVITTGIHFYDCI